MRGNWEFSSFARSCDDREEQFGAVGAPCPEAAAAALVLTGPHCASYGLSVQERKS